MPKPHLSVSLSTVKPKVQPKLSCHAGASLRSRRQSCHDLAHAPRSPVSVSSGRGCLEFLQAFGPGRWWIGASPDMFHRICCADQSCEQWRKGLCCRLQTSGIRMLLLASFLVTFRRGIHPCYCRTRCKLWSAWPDRLGTSSRSSFG